MSTPGIGAARPPRSPKQPPNPSRRLLIALALGAGVTAAAVPWNSGSSASAAAASLTPVTLAQEVGVRVMNLNGSMSPRPARVIRRFEIDLPRPRDADTFALPEFALPEREPLGTPGALG